MVKICYNVSMKYFNYHYKRFSIPKESDYYSHMHNDYELLFFLDGDADYVIGSSIYHLQQNDLLFIKPAIYHCLMLRSSNPYERAHFNFTENVLPEELVPIVQNLNEIYHIPNDSSIKMFFDDLKKAQETFTKEEFNYYKKVVLNLIITNLKYFSKTNTRTPEIINTTLDKILQYIDENIERPLTTAMLSEVFFVSPSWIVHTFKKELDISVKQYINRKKILHAQQLIRRGIPAIKAAEICAYSNYTTFFRQYKHFIGKEPLDDKPEKAK